MSKGRMVSPDEMLEAAKEMQLGGRDPQSKRDWVLVMNFFAVNIDTILASSLHALLAKIYDMPLSEEEVDQIVSFQVSKK